MSRLFSVLGATSVLAGALLLTGCESGSGGITPASGRLIGNIVTASSTAPAAGILVPGTGGATANVTVGGVLQSVTIPSGVGGNVPAGTDLAVILLQSVPLRGTFAPGAQIGVGPNLLGVVTNSGIALNTDGTLPSAFALPILNAAGTPVAIVLPISNIQTRVLTIQTVSFVGKVYVVGGNIINPIPATIDGTIPNNGENAVGSAVTCTWGPGNNGRTAALKVVYGNGFQLNQQQTIAGNAALFNNLTPDTSDVPQNGVQEVSFTIGDRP